VSLSDRLKTVENQTSIPDPVKPKPQIAGWEPGVVWHGSSGQITTDTLYAPPSDWDDILRSRGLDPTKFEVAGDTMKWCSWDGWTKTEDGQTEPAICYSFKADIRMKVTDTKKAGIAEELYREARKAKPSKRRKGGDSTLIVALSDWQVGNRDGGGVERQAAAIADLVESIPQRLADLRRAGHDIGHVALLGMGDLVEGTCGHYAAQQFRVELDRRDQMKLVRRGIRDIIMNTAPEVDKMTVMAIPGNHGENRQNGKSITSVHDNDDVAVFEQIAEILAINPNAYGHVGFKLSRDEIALAANLSGQTVAITHGHTSKPAGNSAQAIWNWWQHQTMGRAYPAVADANILITGHYHHLNLKEQENRTVIICPSLTPVGEYWADANGVRTKPGTLTLITHPHGWGELTLL
jgi:predicted phosphodiesterase